MHIFRYNFCSKFYIFTFLLPFSLGCLKEISNVTCPKISSSFSPKNMFHLQPFPFQLISPFFSVAQTKIPWSHPLLLCFSHSPHAIHQGILFNWSSKCIPHLTSFTSTTITSASILASFLIPLQLVFNIAARVSPVKT